MIGPTRISFGGTAGVVTSMALLTGLHAAHAKAATIISALLIAAVADNLTDSLSVHMYQESERIEQRSAFVGTVVNFGTRFFVCLSFVVLVAMCPPQAAALAGVLWGICLLTGLTWLVARHRKVSVLGEVSKHLGVALAILLVSEAIGRWITANVDTLLALWRAP